MKKRNLAIGIVLLALLGGVIVKGEIMIHQEKVEQQKRKETREKEERKKLNYRLARYLVQNFEFKKPVKSLKFSKKYHYTEWSNTYAVDVHVNDSKDVTMYIFLESLKKLNDKTMWFNYDDDVLDSGKEVLDSTDTKILLKKIKIEEWRKG